MMEVSRETPDWPRIWEPMLTEIVTAVRNDLKDEESRKLTAFARSIIEHNRILHLVSQRQPEREVIKQIADSTAALGLLDLPSQCRLLDVGSGAGIPGIVFKILRPDIELVSLDSSPKKIEFQKQVCVSIGMLAHFVISDFRRVVIVPPADVVTVKALGSHREIIRRATAWLIPGGKLVFMEGKTPDSEIQVSVKKTESYSAEVITAHYSLAGFAGSRQLVTLIKS